MYPPWTEEEPPTGKWPVDPQDAVPVSDDRIWIDGCFDFSHHGHAGAMLQARQLGKELFVGIHSDEAILHNKGPTVMSLEERCVAVDACRWSTLSIPHAPYVTQLTWISHYGCRYVVHGDDITSDSSGEDCYRFVKQAGRFKVVKRTPGISTTDLVGRMLLCTRSHFIKSLQDVLDGREGDGSDAEKQAKGSGMRDRIREYASDESGLAPLVDVLQWPSSAHSNGLDRLVQGTSPKPGQKVVYVDGAFDLFTPGHIEFLRQVLLAESEPVYLVAGIHNDQEVNDEKGINYPIMNIFERGMCVLQCKYVSAVVFGAPYKPSKTYLASFPYPISAVYHGPMSTMTAANDPYADAKSLGLYKEIADHAFSHINAEQIVGRILKSREMFEERQRVKGVKGIGEEAVRRREEMEAEMAAKKK